MNPIRKILNVEDDAILIKMPKGMNGMKVEVSITPIEDELGVTEETIKYDFSDLAGKLTWKGDAVKEQRRLRDEW
ncbi:MAG: hypothetical protein FMNOHCHN_01474 [Ignavibacteriaceae bacterium]|nr:hypothetical protein [Ignavibacteriaceae bacterium]